MSGPAPEKRTGRRPRPAGAQLSVRSQGPCRLRLTTRVSVLMGPSSSCECRSAAWVGEAAWIRTPGTAGHLLCGFGKLTDLSVPVSSVKGGEETCTNRPGLLRALSSVDQSPRAAFAAVPSSRGTGHWPLLAARSSGHVPLVLQPHQAAQGGLRQPPSLPPDSRRASGEVRIPEPVPALGEGR